MKITIGNVWTFKLTSGEEVIGKVTAIEEYLVSLKDPVSVAPGPQGLGLMQSMFTADPKAEFKLNTNSIAIVAMTDDSLKMKYLEATTGIKVPDKKIVLG